MSAYVVVAFLYIGMNLFMNSVEMHVDLTDWIGSQANPLFH